MPMVNTRIWAVVVFLPLLLASGACGDADARLDEADAASAISAEASSIDLQTISLTVPDMACRLCANSVRTQLRAMGVQDVRVDLDTKLVTGRFDSDRLTADSIRDRIEASGFRVAQVEVD